MSREICKDRNLCTGCTACQNVCPKKCIEMVPDAEGFLYPEIDEHLCVNCGLCEQTCPINCPPLLPSATIGTVVARTKNEVFLKNCTSGGVFTTLAEEFIDQGGVVYGAVYDNEFQVVHARITDKCDVIKLAGSKYVQSNLDNCFEHVRKDLKEHRNVLFCGTPCQIAGLNNYLKEKFDNLILVDLVCHGVPSPKLWGEYVDHLTQKYGELISINFRSKNLGYHVSVMEERFKNGRIRLGSARTNLMSKCFFCNVADRYSCYDCQFKTVERCSDLTIFDCWHASDLVEGLTDDDRGYTNIIIQTESGKKAIEQYGETLLLFKTDTEAAVSLDGSMATASVKMNPKREIFYEVLDEKGIVSTVQELLPIRKLDYLIERCKTVMHKAGVLQYVKTMKNKILR